MGRSWLVAAVAALLGTSACGPSAAIYRTGHALVDAGTDSESSRAGASGSGGAGGAAGSPYNGYGGTTSGAGGVSAKEGGAGGSMGNGGAGGTVEMDAGAGGSSGVPDAIVEVAPQPTAFLEASVTAGPANTNLTTEGKLDWVHWGQGRDVAAVNRKRDIPALISTFRKLGGRPLGTYNDRPSAHSWTDGTPNVAITNTRDGMVTGDLVGAGFELRITGSSQTIRNVRLHVGAWEAAAKFTVEVENGGLAVWTDKSLRTTGPVGADRIYTVTFRPKKDTDALVIRWTVDELSNTYGNVTLQAAAVWE